MDQNKSAGALANEDISFEMLQELEKQTLDQIRNQRVHQRVAVKTKVILQPGNSSQLLNLKLQGVTGDISEGGCGAMFPVPVTVGDIYRLHFLDKELDLPMVFARCLRCRLIREDSFEVGFSFFSPVRLSSKSMSDRGAGLV